MVKIIREAEKVAGRVTYEETGKIATARKFGRSLFAVKDIKKGEKFTEKNVKSIRPASGLHPKYLMEILGTAAKKDYQRGEPLIP
jgi:pseudaminic acid synthase